MKENNNLFNKIHSLYIHIPFCNNICTYCDFYKMIAKPSQHEKYIDYLIKELKLRKKFLSDLRTIYIGGGTPSTISNNLLKKLLINLKEEVDFSKIEEFTIEANPNDITQEFIDTIKNSLSCPNTNFIRISLGVQSLNPIKLKFLNRTHDKETVINAINLLQKNGIYNINCDLIYGLQEDKNDKIINDKIIFNDYIIVNDLLTLISLNIPHFSTYSLIIEEKTILNKLIKEKKFIPLDEDSDAKIYDLICDVLKEHNYIHYEVSNFCKENYKSLHNLTYWNDEKYLGIGANASYYIDNIRYTNIDNLAKYYQGLDENNYCYKEKTILTKNDEMFEFVMLGLRKLEGINVNTFKNRFNIDIFTKYNTILPLIENNILEFENDYLKVPENKIYILNEILLKILKEDINNEEN